MGRIVFEKCLPLKQQAGKTQEFTITLRGLDLSPAEEIDLIQLRGVPVKFIRLGDEKAKPPVVQVLDETIAMVAMQIERAYNLGIGSVQKEKPEEEPADPVVEPIDDMLEVV